MPKHDLHEPMRDRTLDEWCSGFQGLGLHAQTSNLGRAEKDIKYWRSHSLGHIDIYPGPISWVNVMRYSDADGGYYLEYGVLDHKVGPSFPRVEIKTVRVRDNPLFGKFIDLRWKGKDCGLGLIDRLSGEVSLRQAILDSGDFYLRAYPGRFGWLLAAGTNSWEGERESQTVAPSRQIWECLQAIARHLLAAQVPYKP